MRVHRSVVWAAPSLLAALAVAAVLVVIPEAAERGPALHAGLSSESGTARPDARGVVLAVHGGAGAALDRETTTPQREKAYRDGLARALRAGFSTHVAKPVEPGELVLVVAALVASGRA